MQNPYHEFEQVIFSVFNEPVDRVARLVEKRWNDMDQDGPDGVPKRYVLQQAAVDFAYAYIDRPSYPTRHRWDPSQLLFWEPMLLPGHTVMMTNAVCGNSHAVFRLSENVPWECIYVNLPDDEASIGSFMLNYYRNYRKIARTLGVGRKEDGRWLFCADGPVQTFEKPEYYKHRRIQDRLNREIITEYLLRLGYDIAQDDFWRSASNAWLLWDNLNGGRTAPGRDGIDPEGTRTGWAATSR